MKIIAILAVLVLALPAEAAVATICISPKSLIWTPWFDRDNPSGNGDYETLAELRNEGAKICPVPVGIECETTSGRPACETGQILHISPTSGCFCVNSEQPDKVCNFDYRVRFQCCQECPYGATTYQTPFFDRDNTSGNGDYETLAELLREGKPICKNPLGVTCQTLAGAPASSTGEVLHIGPAIGCFCVNAEQPDGRCDYDYKVSFECCQACTTTYQTQFFDRDNPSANGDYETLAELLKEGKPICKNPLAVTCQTLAGAPASSTGEILHISPSIGCFCVNAEQPDKKCNYDYKVSFTCCKA